MLVSLAIRDVVLIERLELAFGAGLTVLTGETGAGKSILLDSLGLACGARAEAGLVRVGQAQCAVTAGFRPPAGHPAAALLEEHGIAEDDTLLLRRVVQADGRSRAFVNDQPVAVGLLRRVAATLIEVQGQHEQTGLADPATHGPLLDAFGGLETQRAAVGSAWRTLREAERELAAARAAIAAAEADAEYLRAAVAELAELAPVDGEEEQLAQDRQRLQSAERRQEQVASAVTALRPRDRRTPGPGAAMREAARTLARLPPPEDAAVPPILALLGTAEDALAEAETLLERLLYEQSPSPQQLEQVEERLFALRAAARKYQVPVVGLPPLLAGFRERLANLDAGGQRVALGERATAAARAAYLEAARTLSAARRDAAGRLEAAIGGELPPLKLDRARFVVAVADRASSAYAADGIDDVAFLVATNPGTAPGRLDRIASGGELSRLMLAIKVVLARGSTVPTLIFDEVDTGIGGATAAAVGERLARVAERLQVLLVTHSPQVAARGAQQLRVAKRIDGERAATTVEALDRRERREEIARMLAGERVTDAARAAADSLLTGGLL